MIFDDGGFLDKLIEMDVPELKRVQETIETEGVFQKHECIDFLVVVYPRIDIKINDPDSYILVEVEQYKAIFINKDDMPDLYFDPPGVDDAIYVANFSSHGGFKKELFIHIESVGVFKRLDTIESANKPHVVAVNVSKVG